MTKVINKSLRSAVIQSLIPDVLTTYKVVTIIIIINIILGLYVLFPEKKSWQFQLHNYLKILNKSAKMLNYLVKFVGKQQDEFISVLNMSSEFLTNYCI